MLEIFFINNQTNSDVFITYNLLGSKTIKLNSFKIILIRHLLNFKTDMREIGMSHINIINF